MHRRITLALACLGLLFCNACTGTPMQAATASELDGLTVVGHYFSTKVNNGRRYLGVKDPKKMRMVILKLRASVAEKSSVIFATDFVVAYRHRNGLEDRANCAAIAKAPQEGLKTDNFLIGPTARLSIAQGSQYFAVLFAIEPDVEAVDLYRLGDAVPLHYKLGSERPYSVYISTRADPSVESKICVGVKKGGYQITGVSHKLSTTQSGFSVHYKEMAETEARDIAARLTLQLGEAPKLVKEDVVTPYDIVIWFGKPTSSGS